MNEFEFEFEGYNMRHIDFLFTIKIVKGCIN